MLLLLAALTTGGVARAAGGIPGGLEGGTGWINTAGPIHLENLRGKVVLLDFWTFCCINCHHVLPELAALEEKYKNQLVVIGVHTAKFPAEKITENIRRKVAEYRVRHPVVNDANQVIWNRFAVESWPTLIVIDAKGNYSGRISGEGVGPTLDKYIGNLIAQHRARGELDETPLVFHPEADRPHEGGLLYPGKILADPKGDRIFIADTGHNRIVITGPRGKVLDVVGKGDAGKDDGPYDKASFNRPQGMCLIDQTLYVADTESHAIRAIDLKDRTVATIAGTGVQSHGQPRGEPARRTGLNSPWDLIRLPGTNSLAIAMAGPHQIWKLDLADETIGVWAGSGVENIADGPLESAAFAQPSGLATDGAHLFVADSETSSVRIINLQGKNRGQVGRIVGVGLFGFGDHDGKGADVRLQHCLGVTFGDGHLYIADTYNNKIKVCDPLKRTVRTFLGGPAGSTDDPPRFFEPGGLSLAGRTLYVADTNNHAIRAINLDDQKVTTLDLSDLKPPAPPAATRPKFPNPIVQNVSAASVAPGDRLSLAVSLKLPRGFKINPGAPMPILVEAPDASGNLGIDAPANGARIEPPAATFTVAVPLARAAKDGEELTVRLSASAFLCKAGSEGICKQVNYVWNVPVRFADGGADRVELTNAEKPRGR